MTRFRVRVTNTDKTAGLGPVEVSADSAEEARTAFVAGEATTVEKLAGFGLTEWEILPV